MPLILMHPLVTMAKNDVFFTNRRWRISQKTFFCSTISGLCPLETNKITGDQSTGPPLVHQGLAPARAINSPLALNEKMQCTVCLYPSYSANANLGIKFNRKLIYFKKIINAFIFLHVYQHVSTIIGTDIQHVKISPQSSFLVHKNWSNMTKTAFIETDTTAYKDPREAVHLLIGEWSQISWISGYN